MIETARLVLRAPTAADLAWRLEAMNSPAVMRHLGGVRAPEDVAAGLAKESDGFAKQGPGYWTIWLAGERAGKCGLSAIDSEHAPHELQGCPQIGWSLAERYWGQGIAAEAARVVLSHGFTALGYEAIWSQTSDSNAASTRLMARLGFARRPELDYADPDYPAEDNPTAVYSLARAAWEAAR
jgi:RimJ/RimL family protein N-acetyltransferase